MAAATAPPGAEERRAGVARRAGARCPANRDGIASVQAACRGRQGQSSEFSASAKSPPSRTADATAIAAARSASPAAPALPAPRERCDSRAPSARAGCAAEPRPSATECRAAAGCPCPWPPAAGLRDRRPGMARRGASRRQENPRSRSECRGGQIFLDRVGAQQPWYAEERRELLASSLSAAFIDAMPSSISCLARSIGIVLMVSGWFWLWVPMVWPASRELADAFRSGLGHAADDEEGRLDALRGENVQHLVAVCAAAGRHRRSAPPRDRRAAASRHIAWCRCADAALDRPPAFARCPSASGWPGQSAADAVWAMLQASSPRPRAAHGRGQTPTNALPTMKHRLHSYL